LKIIYDQVGQVEQLYVYPVKSFAPVAVASFSTLASAARAKDMVDRQFIVVDRSHHHYHRHHHCHHHHQNHHHHSVLKERESKPQGGDGLT